MQCLGKRELNPGIELLETFADSPSGLRQGGGESHQAPQLGFGATILTMEYILLSIFLWEGLLFIFLLVPKYVYNKLYALGI